MDRAATPATLSRTTAVDIDDKIHLKYDADGLGAFYLYETCFVLEDGGPERGARPGFSNSRRMLVTVGRPKVSSTKDFGDAVEVRLVVVHRAAAFVCGFNWRRISLSPISALISLLVAARIRRTTG